VAWSSFVYPNPVLMLYSKLKRDMGDIIGRGKLTLMPWWVRPLIYIHNIFIN
jgi:hypothetical protein